MEDPELGFPAQVYLEGHDQYRGWFQTSLLLALAAKGLLPFVVVADVNRIHDREKDRAKDKMDDGLTVSILR